MIMMEIRFSAKIVLPLIFAVIAFVAFAEAAAEHACHEEAGGSFAGRDRMNISRTAGRAFGDIPRWSTTIFDCLLTEIKRAFITAFLFFQTFIVMAQRELRVTVERGLVLTSLFFVLLWPVVVVRSFKNKLCKMFISTKITILSSISSDFMPV